MGTQLPSPKWGQSPQFSGHLLWPNGWLYQDGTCHVGRPRPRPHRARWGPRSPSPEKGEQPPMFGPCLLWPKAGCIRIPLGMEVGLGPGHIVLDGDPAPPFQERERSPHKSQLKAPHFRLISIVTKQLDGSRCHLVWRYASAQATLC